MNQQKNKFIPTDKASTWIVAGLLFMYFGQFQISVFRVILQVSGLGVFIFGVVVFFKNLFKKKGDVQTKE